jgi:pSer/pThr/pTyr-binding forkhead associated (FHA) protein
MAYVTVFTPGAQPQRHTLRECNVLGRSSANDIPVSECNVSRHHCRIERIDGQWMLIDLDSTNGTWLDEARVRRYALRDAETFYVGAARIVFYSENRVEHRPADPHEASRSARLLETAETLADTLAEVQSARPLPMAGATIVGRNRHHRRHDAPRSLAFRRPPAQPIIKLEPSGGWVRSVLSRIRRH